MSGREDLSTLLREAERGGKTAKRDLLRYLRRTNLRLPELAVTYGGEILRSGPAWLGDEQWTLREQVLVAALDVDDGALVDECAKALFSKFPEGSRTGRLQGMLLETLGDYKGANEIYDRMIKENEANSLARKRKISVLLHQGRTAEAIRGLQGYLEAFPTDTSAWLELAALSEEQGDFDAAKFCYEELLAASPLHAVTHMRYAEVLCTLGSPERCKLARHHFAQSLELQRGGNLRAALGLCAAAHAIATSKGPVARAEPEHNLALHRLGRKLARDAYDSAGAPAELRDATLEVLEAQAAAMGVAPAGGGDAGGTRGAAVVSDSPVSSPVALRKRHGGR